MRSPIAPRLAWSALALTVGLSAAAEVLLALTPAEIRAGRTVWAEALLALSLLAYAAVGALVAARRPENAIGWLFGAIGLAGEVHVLAVGYAGAVLRIPDESRIVDLTIWLPLNLWVVAFGLAPLLFLLFPDGRLPSRRWRPAVWLILAEVAGGLVTSGADEASRLTPRFPFLVGLLGIELTGQVLDVVSSFAYLTMLATYALAPVAMVIRWRRSRSEARQQLKWFMSANVLLALVVVATTLVVFMPPLRAIDPDAEYPAAVFLGIPMALALTALPLAAGIAILKYRLYDIDLLINRTLVYGALTSTLVLIYYGGVAGLQGLLRGLTGGGSELAIVGSTLAIAALFQPLRRRLQAGIDRRFYRRKYDAARTLAAFGIMVRDEVDLERLANRLLAVVEETMQPAHVSLWLRSPSGAGRARRGDGG